MRRILALILCAFALSAQATTLYVVSGGTGNQSGSDWGNALPNLNSLTRGNTYYVASGSFGQVIFNTPVSGSTYIYIRKATSSAHGTATGWQSGYGTGQAVFSWNGACWDIRTSYLDFEGVIGTSTNSDYGFKLSSSYFGNQQNGCITVYSSAINGFNVRHTQMVAAGPSATDQNDACIYVNGGVTPNSTANWLIQNCFLDNCTAWVQLTQGNGITIDHNYMRNCGSFGGIHCAGIAMGAQNVTISYNVFENMLGPSVTTYIEPQGNAGNPNPTRIGGNWYIYGNVFRATSSQEFANQWANFSVTSQNYMDNVQFYNNTSYGLHNAAGISGGNIDGSTNFRVQNNVWVNCANTVGLQRVNIQSQNATSPQSFGDVLWTGTFVDAANGDFHLSAQTVNGVSLVAPYNVDPDGVTRQIGQWSLGAYQYTGNLPPPMLPVIGMSMASYSCNETNSSVTLTLTKSGTGACSVHYYTSPGTATPGNDYTSTSGTQNFLAGDTQQTITIPIIDQHILEQQPRNFYLNLDTPIGCTLNVSGAMILVNMNSQPLPPPAVNLQLSTNAIAVVQPTGSPATFQVICTRTGSSVGAVSATLATVNGTATATHDFTALSTSVNWADGDSTPQTNLVTLLASGDTAVTNRNFAVTLSAPVGTGAVLGSPIVEFVTLVMNLPPSPPGPVLPGTFSLTSPSYSTTEGVNVSIPVVWSGESGTNASVSYQAFNQTALSGVDYTLTPGVLNFSTNGTQNVTITILNTGKFGTQPLKFLFGLSNPTSGAALGLAQTLISINLLTPFVLQQTITVGGKPVWSGQIQIGTK